MELDCLVERNQSLELRHWLNLELEVNVQASLQDVILQEIPNSSLFKKKIINLQKQSI